MSPLNPVHARLGLPRLEQQPGRALLTRGRAYIYRHRLEVGVLLLFIIVSLAVTHPIWLNFSSHIVGCCDSWHHIWTIWWTKQALFSGNFSSPMFTDYMYFPTGTNVGFESMSHRLVGSLLWPVLGGIITYNLLYLSNLVLAAFGTYLLVKYLTGDRRAALVSGVIFGYSTIHLQYWSYLNISTVQWFPFFALWLLKTVDSPTAGRGLVSGGFFVLLVLSSGYYAIAGSLFLAVFLLWHIREVFTVQFAKAFFYFVWVSVLLITPFMSVFIRESVAGEDFLKMSQFSRHFSADGLGLITPPSVNPLYEGLVEGLYPRFLTVFPERESYLGGLALLLAAIGLFTARHRRMLFWVLVLALFTIVSMGSHVQLLGKEFEEVKLPFYFLKDLPGFDSMRSPKNFLNVTMLAVAVLAGFGTHHLIRRRFSVRTFLANIAISLIVVALLFDYWGWPRSLPISDASVPEFYRELSHDQSEVVVLHIPIPSLENPKPLYYQTVHGKKMIGGYVASQRLLPVAQQFVNENRFLSSIHVYVAESKPAMEEDEVSDALELLRTYPEIEYVVLEKTYNYYFWIDDYTPLGSFHRFSPWLQSLFGQPAYEDEEIQVFKVVGIKAPG